MSQREAGVGFNVGRTVIPKPGGGELEQVVSRKYSC